MTKFSRLIRHPNSRSVRFDTGAFVAVEVGDDVVQRRRGPRRFVGLTRIVQRVLPVPFRSRRCPSSSLSIVGTVTGQRSDLVGGVGGVSSTCKGATDVEHGSIVDAEVRWLATAVYQRTGRLPDGVDPCTTAIASFIRDRLGWRVVGTQVPVRAPSLGDFATAIDLVCASSTAGDDPTDRLFVVEVKASRSTRAADDDASYRRSVGTGVGALSALPASYYVQHQLQLWAMVRAVEHDCDVGSVDGAVVLRASAGYVRAYWFDDNLFDRPSTMRALVRRFRAFVRARTRAGK
jgi:hypothetical protein